MTTQPVSVLVADDQPLLRAALSALIGNIPGFTVLAEAADGTEAVAIAHTCSGVKVLTLTTFDFDQPAASASALEQITDREREVLALVARGLSNAEIAETLFLSAATVKTYMSRLLAKLNARDRAQLVMIAYETRLVIPGR